MEIKVGQYVRSKEGYIGKVININEYREPDLKYALSSNYFNSIIFTSEENIKKASYDIIDLIEEGDVVNNRTVIYVEDLDALEYLSVDEDGNMYYSSIYKDCNKPKSIVTHERMIKVM